MLVPLALRARQRPESRLFNADFSCVHHSLLLLLAAGCVRNKQHQSIWRFSCSICLCIVYLARANLPASRHAFTLEGCSLDELAATQAEIAQPRTSHIVSRKLVALNNKISQFCSG